MPKTKGPTRKLTVRQQLMLNSFRQLLPDVPEHIRLIIMCYSVPRKCIKHWKFINLNFEFWFFSEFEFWQHHSSFQRKITPKTDSKFVNQTTMISQQSQHYQTRILRVSGEQYWQINGLKRDFIQSRLRWYNATRIRRQTLGYTIVYSLVLSIPIFKNWWVQREKWTSALKTKNTGKLKFDHESLNHCQVHKNVLCAFLSVLAFSVNLGIYPILKIGKFSIIMDQQMLEILRNTLKLKTKSWNLETG